MEEAGDGIGVGDDLEDTHAAAALAAEGDVDREDPGEEIGPTDAARSGRGTGGELGARAGERQRELGPGRLRLGLRDDAGAEPMMAREDAVVAGHVKAWRRDQGAQTRHELLDVHIDVGNAETRRPSGSVLTASWAKGGRSK